MALSKIGTDGISADTAINGFTPTVSNMAGRNRIINGDMRISQRNGGASVTPTSGEYIVDRFKAEHTVASKFSGQQVTTAPPGFTNSVLLTSLSAYSVASSDVIQFAQAIEGFNIADLGWGTANAQAATLSFWVRSSLTGTFGGSLGAGGNDYNLPFSYSISAANTWEHKTVSIPAPTTGTFGTTNSYGVIARWSLGCGSNFLGTPGSWTASTIRGVTGQTNLVETNGATMNITGVQLEEGSVATPFEHRMYGQELALCQRYFYMLAKGDGINFAACNYWGTGEVDAYISFKVPMRISPTVYQITGTNYFNIDKSGNDPFDGFAGTVRSNANGGMLYTFSGVSGTNGFAAQIQTYNANAVIAFQAEL